MRRANREAVLRGAEYVGSEHVLLALIDLASGITRKVFKNFDVDRQKIRTEIEKHIQSGPNTAAFRNLPQTPRVKQVIQYSVEEAKNTTGDLVDSEHILLGHCADESVAGQVLFNLGLTLMRARQEVLKLSRG